MAFFVFFFPNLRKIIIFFFNVRIFFHLLMENLNFYTYLPLIEDVLIDEHKSLKFTTTINISTFFLYFCLRYKNGLINSSFLFAFRIYSANHDTLDLLPSRAGSSRNAVGLMSMYSKMLRELCLIIQQYYLFSFQYIRRPRERWSPTNKNCTVESSQCEMIADVNQSGVQWKGLSLRKPS